MYEYEYSLLINALQPFIHSCTHSHSFLHSTHISRFVVLSTPRTFTPHRSHVTPYISNTHRSASAFIPSHAGAPLSFLFRLSFFSPFLSSPPLFPFPFRLFRSPFRSPFLSCSVLYLSLTHALLAHAPSRLGAGTHTPALYISYAHTISHARSHTTHLAHPISLLHARTHTLSLTLPLSLSLPP